MKLLFPFLGVAVLVLTHTGSALKSSLLATTEEGVLQGTYVRSATSQGRLPAFLGVPYARPPVGTLRFRPPEPADPWHGVRPADADPPSCHQREELFFGDFAGARAKEPREPHSEDCLYLNVYVPPEVIEREEEEEEEDKNGDQAGNNGLLLPVMVWFHGGGFSRGSVAPRGDDDEDDGWSSDPSELASQGGVVVVTVQYRLGALGFLFLDDDGAPGNAGLMDQTMALEWVRRNVGSFGGDPTRVTLAGQGAGAVSAAIQTVVAARDARNEVLPPSERPKSLILHSSGIQHPWSYSPPARAFTRALKLATLLGCPTSGSKKDVVSCLAQKSPEDIVNKESGVEAEDGSGGPEFHPFVVTTDGRLVTAEPRQMLRDAVVGRNAGEDEGKMSILIGSNEDEGTEALMYILPSLFPNREVDRPGLSRNEFSESVDRIFGGGGGGGGPDAVSSTEEVSHQALSRSNYS